jgi:hypothetical protein
MSTDSKFIYGVNFCILEWRTNTTDPLNYPRQEWNAGFRIYIGKEFENISLRLGFEYLNKCALWMVLNPELVPDRDIKSIYAQILFRIA